MIYLNYFLTFKTLGVNASVLYARGELAESSVLLYILDDICWLSAPDFCNWGPIAFWETWFRWSITERPNSFFTYIQKFKLHKLSIETYILVEIVMAPLACVALSSLTMIKVLTLDYRT